MPDPVVVTGQVANWIWENKREIGKLLTGLYGWFRGKGRKDKRGILVIGPGGSGKTTLGLLLSGEYDWLTDSPRAYTESRKLERYTLKDDKRVEVVVPPGQKHRREAYWSNLQADIAAGKFRGVILLAAYGYHTLAAQLSYKDHPLYARKKGAFLGAYLEEHRREELRILQQLTPYLGLCPHRVWLLTLVAKQDLWWDDHAAVERHYRDGEYGGEVRKLSTAKGNRDFRHETVLASLVISNFDTSRQERLKANAEGYDQRMQVESIRRLMETAGALKDWETGK
jgi:hypothetical protein